jgi:hypothetical protein
VSEADSAQKPREFWITLNATDRSGHRAWDCFPRSEENNFIHVIEHSYAEALEAKLRVMTDARDDVLSERNELRAQNEKLMATMERIVSDEKIVASTVARQVLAEARGDK